MSEHSYKNNIAEIKIELTSYLTRIMTPLLYEGLKLVYDRSVEIEKRMIIKKRGSKNIPSSIIIFQALLGDMRKMNQDKIDTETARIKAQSGISEYFDALVRSVFKSYIILFTLNSEGKVSRIVKQKYHEKISIPTFIHKCYIECSKVFFNNPYLFYHKFVTSKIKENQLKIFMVIEDCIKHAIKTVIPMNLILSEFLRHDYLPPRINTFGKLSSSEYAKMKNMLDVSENSGPVVAESESDSDHGSESESDTEHSHHHEHEHEHGHNELPEPIDMNKMPVPGENMNKMIIPTNDGVIIEENNMSKPKTPTKPLSPTINQKEQSPHIPQLPQQPTQQTQSQPSQIGGCSVEDLKNRGLPSMFFGLEK